MSGIFRTNKDKNYFYASNEPFNDSRLSWEARGVIGYLLSKPDGWTCRNYDLESQGPAGACKLKRIMAELRKYGYLRRYRQRKPDGTFEWITDVFESPQLNPTIVSKSTSGLSTNGKPTHIVITESDKTNNNINGKSNDLPPQQSDNQKTDNQAPIKPKTELLNYFLDYTKLEKPTNGEMGFWWSRLGIIYTIAGEDVPTARRLIKQSVDKLRADDLTISTPGSLVKTIRALAANGNTGKVKMSAV